MNLQSLNLFTNTNPSKLLDMKGTKMNINKKTNQSTLRRTRIESTTAKNLVS
jgi:hypothetical protein